MNQSLFFIITFFILNQRQLHDLSQGYWIKKQHSITILHRFDESEV